MIKYEWKKVFVCIYMTVRVFNWGPRRFGMPKKKAFGLLFAVLEKQYLSCCFSHQNNTNNTTIFTRNLAIPKNWRSNTDLRNPCQYK